ncbi:hypothetical protein Goshw_019185 [Gossypium schwendimanii]|nr:hypothetical protein [Gossypium schwendimanii]
MHTFHLSCRECTITLDDVQLQLRFPVDGSILTESVQFADRGAHMLRSFGCDSE